MNTNLVYRLLLLLGVGICTLQSCKDASPSTSEITVVCKPALSSTNVNYLANKAPLQALHFIKLPVGTIQPEGWVKRYLELQRDGLTGKLGEISAWLEKENNAWLTTGGDHGWEEVPYWLKGYGDLAYILKDEKMIAETKVWIEGAFASQRADGYFGPVNMRNGKYELWANMIMLNCLQSYYEFCKDERVIQLMTQYFKWQLTVPDDQFLEDYWENSRGGDNMASVYWLYNLTGDAFLLDLGTKLHRNTANWTQPSSLPNWHNVNIAQSFREPATYYQQTGDSSLLKATENVFHLIRRTFGQVPGGMFGSDENCRLGYIDPRQGVEACGMVEQMASDAMLIRITGDVAWADNCEDVAFNTYPAAVMPDFKALRYITCPNHVLSDSKNHSPGIDNGGPFLMMNPFSSRCCQHNHAQGWPYYAENLIMATPDNGLAAILYSSCATKAKVSNGTEVSLLQETEYPFNEQIKFTLQTASAVNFPLYLRIPTWCTSAKISINGKPQALKDAAGQFVKIERTWTNADVVELTLPMELTKRTWQVNRNSVSIDYGPLTLSLKIKENYIEMDSKASAIGDSKWQKGADASKWPSHEIHPASAWNYGLVLNHTELNKQFELVRKPWPADNFPFSQDGVPLEFKAKGKLIPEWKIDEYGLCGILPDSPVKTASKTEDITLIPMGAARLRISAFPVTE